MHIHTYTYTHIILDESGFFLPLIANGSIFSKIQFSLPKTLRTVQTALFLRQGLQSADNQILLNLQSDLLSLIQDLKP